MNKELSPEICAGYQANLDYNRQRLTELRTDGVEALSDHDKQLFKGDEYRAVVASKWATEYRIGFYETMLQECQEITIFPEPAPDAHLEAQYEDQQSGGGEYE